jgi:hypothetical protein
MDETGLPYRAPICAVSIGSGQYFDRIADPHLSHALTSLLEVTLAVDESAPCIDPACTVPGCCVQDVQ